MPDRELTGAGRAGFGAACVACCAAPMLVLAGVALLACAAVLSLATAATKGSDACSAPRTE